MRSSSCIQIPRNNPIYSGRKRKQDKDAADRYEKQTAVIFHLGLLSLALISPGRAAARMKAVISSISYVK